MYDLMCNCICVSIADICDSSIIAKMQINCIFTRLKKVCLLFLSVQNVVEIHTLYRVTLIEMMYVIYY